MNPVKYESKHFMTLLVNKPATATEREKKTILLIVHLVDMS